MSNSTKGKSGKLNSVYLASLIICVILAVWGIFFSDSHDGKVIIHITCIGQNIHGLTLINKQRR